MMIFWLCVTLLFGHSGDNRGGTANGEPRGQIILGGIKILFLPPLRERAYWEETPEESGEVIDEQLHPDHLIPH